MKKRSRKGKGYFYAMGQRDGSLITKPGDKSHFPSWAMHQYNYGWNTGVVAKMCNSGVAWLKTNTYCLVEKELSGEEHTLGIYETKQIAELAKWRKFMDSGTGVASYHVVSREIFNEVL